MNKRIFFRLAPIAAAVLVLSAFGWSQIGPKKEPVRPNHRTSVPNRSVEERVKQFSSMMGLSASQSAKVRKILNTQNEKMRTVAIGNNLTTEQRKKKVDAYRKETDTLIRQVLTAAQRKKFDKLVKEARSKQSSSLKGAPMPGKTRAPIKP